MQCEVEEQCTAGSCRFSFQAYSDVCIASNPLVRLLVQARARMVFKSRLHHTVSRLKLSPSQTYCKAGTLTLLAVDWLRGARSFLAPLSFFPCLLSLSFAAACPPLPLLTPLSSFCVAPQYQYSLRCSLALPPPLICLALVFSSFPLTSHTERE